MGEEFVPLAEFLRPLQSPPASGPPATSGLESSTIADAQDPDVLSRVRRFHAGLADALDIAVPAMLREIAHEVLGRELHLAPCDLASIVRSTLARHAGERVVTIHANPGDVPALRSAGIDCAEDPALERGDVVVCLRSGTIDLRMNARLDAILAA